MSVKPKPGEWVVVDDCGYVALEVVKVTAQLTLTKSRWGGAHTNHRRTATLLFAGPENTAKRLAEQLKTSRALAAQEIHKAQNRHRDRIAALIQRAENLSASASEAADDASGMSPNPTESQTNDR